VARVVAAAATREGAGVKLVRTIGSRDLSMVDPFLLLDEMRSSDPRDYEPGFPRHPHRGFETVTYVIAGAVEHGDSLGNRGRLTAGSLQWMTAGRGIIHSEMPKRGDERSTELHALQLWVNLPRSAKMTAPRYQDIAPGRVPEVGGGARVRVLAGQRAAATGPVDGVVAAPVMLDVTLARGEQLAHELPLAHSAFVYGLDGVAIVGSGRTPLSRGDLAVLGPGPVALVSAPSEPARVLIVAAAPIREPVARRGPFVMSTEAELDRAFEDYRAGRLTDPG
jgi:quercetin 2,3-dioxygenase